MQKTKLKIFSDSGFSDLGFEDNGLDIEFANEYHPANQEDSISRHVKGTRPNVIPMSQEDL